MAFNLLKATNRSLGSDSCNCIDFANVCFSIDLVSCLCICAKHDLEIEPRVRVHKVLWVMTEDIATRLSKYFISFSIKSYFSGYYLIFQSAKAEPGHGENGHTSSNSQDILDVSHCWVFELIRLGFTARAGTKRLNLDTWI